MRSLILFAHPALHKSRVNAQLIEGLDQIEGVTFNDLYQEYPELDIDVKREQALLAAHEVIIFQFPLFWYSTPAILKEWQDLVLEHGWAYGQGGNALKDKLFLCAISVGGRKQSYQINDFHEHTLSQLLAPLRQTAKLCKMLPLPPFAIHGAHGIQKPEIEAHKNSFLKLLKLFKDGSFQAAEALHYEYLNDYLDTLNH